ncbi:MAG: V-type ATP synthase subunit K [Candidatus Altiarchaeota archaeon]
MDLATILSYLFTGNVLAALGVAIGVGLAGIGASKGLGTSGATAAALTAEQEKNFAIILMLEFAPQTQVLYAFAVSILIIFYGIMGGTLDVEKGLICLAAGLTVGLTGLTAISQGIAASAAVAAYGRNNRIPFQVLVYVAMCEISAIIGCITGILLLKSGGIF